MRKNKQVIPIILILFFISNGLFNTKIQAQLTPYKIYKAPGWGAYGAKLADGYLESHNEIYYLQSSIAFTWYIR